VMQGLDQKPIKPPAPAATTAAAAAAGGKASLPSNPTGSKKEGEGEEADTLIGV